MNQKLVFDNADFKQLSEKKRNIFIYEWLCFVDKALPTYNRNEIKDNQHTIVNQLHAQFHLNPGPPIRTLIAKNIATIFEIGDILSLYDTIEYCNNILKAKDESKNQKFAKLCSLDVLGSIYERIGRMVGRSYEATMSILTKCLKTSDVDIKIEILNAMEKMIKGINTAGASIFKDIYKQLKSLLTDQSIDIRCATANVCRILN
jgi:hypothetical protein